MNIWLIQTGESIPHQNTARSMRTSKIADELVRRGHEVLWWASAFDHFSKSWVYDSDTLVDVCHNFCLYALKGCGYRRNVSLRRLADYRMIAKKFHVLAGSVKRPDLIIASLPAHDLAYEAVRFGRLQGVPVIVDIRDPWPDVFLDNVPAILKPVAGVVLARDFSMVREAMRGASALTAVTDNFLEWALRYAGRSREAKDRVFYLGGSQLKSDEETRSEQERIEELYDLKNKFVILFIGTFANYHNPEILLECAGRLRGREVAFVIAGSGEFFNRVKDQADTLPNVHLTGWVGDRTIRALLALSHVGVCPTTKEAALFPNKAFSYLSAGLPVISAFQGDLRRLLEKHNFGRYYPPNDCNSLVECVKELCENKALYDKMSENARRVFTDIFGADRIYAEYVDYIEDMISHGKRMRN